MPDELTVRIRIALSNLSEAYPNDRPTIEWLTFAETEQTEIPLWVQVKCGDSMMLLIVFNSRK